MLKFLKKLHVKIHQKKIEIVGLLKKNKERNNDIEGSIDFVVTWVDGNDAEWKKLKEQFGHNISKKGNGIERYRDWNQFMYWFRSVEKYAPWVRNIYLITCGNYPEWLKLESPKLRVITHKEYIPEKYLPTFSSIPIEMNIHRIPELSEYFVYFNDDMYLSRPVEPKDFFENGKPKYCAIAYPLKNYGYNGPFAHQLFSVLGIINSKFNVQQSIEEHPELWFSKVYGDDKKYNRRAYEESYLQGMYFSHLPCPFLKSTFVEVWNKIPDVLDETCLNRFRTPVDIMHQVISLWDIMRGNFSPVDSKYYGKNFGMLSKQVKEIEDAFRYQKYRTVCLNDSIDITNQNFDNIKRNLDTILNEVFPNKSVYEK